MEEWCEESDGVVGVGQRSSGITRVASMRVGRRRVGWGMIGSVSVEMREDLALCVWIEEGV